jgi:diacylglycerol kinase (ATP)
MGSPAVVIGNPRSGRAGGLSRLKRYAELIGERLGEVELWPTERPEHARELASLAGDTLVVAAGGDGTINEVINGLSPGATLGILPLGTANVLARELGLPLDLEAACLRIAEGEAVRIDLGVATNRHRQSRLFACMAGIGFDASVVRAVDPFAKHRLGKLAFVITAVRLYATRDFPPARLLIGGDGKKRLVSGARLAVLSNAAHYGGPFRMSSRRDLLYSGELELIVVERVSTLLRPDVLLPFIACRSLDRTVRCFTTTGLEAQAADGEEVPVQLDGEPWGSLPMSFGIRPKALRVIR